MDVDLLGAAVDDGMAAVVALTCRRLLYVVRRRGTRLTGGWAAASVRRFRWAQSIGCPWARRRLANRAAAAGSIEVLETIDPAVKLDASLVTEAARHLHFGVIEWLLPRLEPPADRYTFSQCRRSVREWAARRGHATVDVSDWVDVSAVEATELCPTDQTPLEQWRVLVNRYIDDTPGARQAWLDGDYTRIGHPAYWWRHQMVGRGRIKLPRHWDFIADVRPLGDYQLIIYHNQGSPLLLTPASVIPVRFAMFSSMAVVAIRDGRPVDSNDWGFNCRVMMVSPANPQTYHDRHTFYRDGICGGRMDGGADLMPWE